MHATGPTIVDGGARRPADGEEIARLACTTCVLLATATPTPAEKLSARRLLQGARMPNFSQSVEAYRTRFHEDGFVCLEGVVAREPLAELTRSLRARLRSDRAAGLLPHGGGSLNGHLNCFPGAESRFVYEALERQGVFELVRRLSDQPIAQPNVGCTVNLAGSHAQNEHVDGYAATPFLIVNVAAVDTDRSNGATEILPGTHRRTHKYWEVALGGLRRRRVSMKQGDVLLRISSLWHRGMPNHSVDARPMLAFTWENGGNRLSDPYGIHGGRLTFLPNRFATDWRSRMVERAFVMAPRLGKTFHVVRSLLI
jgi:hypothetical protein